MFCGWLLQELEIVIGDEHISFTTAKIGSLVDVNQSKFVPFLFTLTLCQPHLSLLTISIVFVELYVMSICDMWQYLPSLYQ